MRHRIIPIAILIFCLPALPGQSPVQLDSRVDPAQVTVGDLIRLTLTVTADPGVEVDLPEPDPDMGEFEVLGHEVAGPVEDDGRRIWTVVYTLALYKTGSFEIPPVAVSYRGEGVQAGSVRTQEHSVRVESTLSDDSKDILDIKGPLEIPRSLWSLWPWFAAALGLAALIFLYLRRKGGEAPSAVSREPRLSPYDEAYQALRRLRDSGLLEEGQLKPYFTRLSEIIRRYLERRYLIQAMESTTTQLLDQLRKMSLALDELKLFRDFFPCCDLVKFAKYAPTVPEQERITELAFRILEVTRPTEPVLPATEESTPESAGHQRRDRRRHGQD
ncbi:MAG: BatD family protein [Acidobacteriota bacterium]|nr:BatD family protein [Acidobacteriota bacterium]